MSGWTAISLRYPPSLEDVVVGILQDAGTLGLHLGESEATAYFGAGADLASVRRELESVDGAVVTAARSVQDGRWAERQDEQRRPIRIGRRFEILPRVEWRGAAATDAVLKRMTGRGLPQFWDDSNQDTLAELADSAGSTEGQRAGSRGASSPRPRHRTTRRGATSEAGRGDLDSRSARDSDPRADGGGAAVLETARGEQTLPIRLVIPPQRAFGTGEHETTRLCLEALEALPIRGARVLDLGTGSGILAMAAERLGAAEVLGLDTDPEAIEVARENVELNGCARVRLEAGALSRAKGPFDLIVANIYASTLGALAEDLSRLQSGQDRRDGLGRGSIHLILSGFSAPEAADLEGRFTPFGYRREALVTSGEWAALVLRRA